MLLRWSTSSQFQSWMCWWSRPGRMRTCRMISPSFMRNWILACRTSGTCVHVHWCIPLMYNIFSDQNTKIHIWWDLCWQTTDRYNVEQIALFPLVHAYKILYINSHWMTAVYYNSLIPGFSLSFSAQTYMYYPGSPPFLSFSRAHLRKIEGEGEPGTESCPPVATLASDVHGHGGHTLCCSLYCSRTALWTVATLLTGYIDTRWVIKVVDLYLFCW